MIEAPSPLTHTERYRSLTERIATLERQLADARTDAALSHASYRAALDDYEDARVDLQMAEAQNALLTINYQTALANHDRDRAELKDARAEAQSFCEYALNQKARVRSAADMLAEALLPDPYPEFTRRPSLEWLAREAMDRLNAAKRGPQ